MEIKLTHPGLAQQPTARVVARYFGETNYCNLPPVRFERFVRNMARRLGVPQPERYVVRYESGGAQVIYRYCTEAMAKLQLDDLRSMYESRGNAPLKIFYLDRGLDGKGEEVQAL